jgi:hypothetical protein
MSKESGRGTGWHHKVRGESEPEIEEHVQNPAAYADAPVRVTTQQEADNVAFLVEELDQPKPPEEETVAEKPKPRPRSSSKRPGSSKLDKDAEEE